MTVLMPVKTFQRNFLLRAIESIFGQTLDRWRLLVVVEPIDDPVLRDVLANALGDERVRLLVNDGSRLAGAVNTGMRRAETEFTAILLGDDMWAPEAVEVLDDAIERFPDVDFFHSSRVIVDEDDRRISRIFASRESFTLEDFVQSSPVKHLLCWRREKGLAIGGIDEGSSIGPDDWDFPWSMAEAGARFMALPQCLYLYRDHRDGYRLTTHLPLSRQTRAIRRVIRKHGIGRRQAFRAARAKKRRHLRQCLYRTSVDRFVKERLLGRDARRGWRENYR